jgi:hypothetical protein
MSELVEPEVLKQKLSDYSESFHEQALASWRNFISLKILFNRLTPELNPSSQRCLTRFFTGDFASWTVNFVNICLKTQQMQQLLIQFINYVW